MAHAYNNMIDAASAYHSRGRDVAALLCVRTGYHLAHEVDWLVLALEIGARDHFAQQAHGD